MLSHNSCACFVQLVDAYPLYVNTISMGFLFDLGFDPGIFREISLKVNRTQFQDYVFLYKQCKQLGQLMVPAVV